MPLGRVSDEDFDKELRNSQVEIDKQGVPSIGIQDNPTESEPAVLDEVTGEIVTQKIGRGLGSNEVPESLRKILAQTNLESGRSAAISLAQSFGISESSVSAYLAGATSTSTYDKKDKGLDGYLKSLKQKSAKRASLKLLKAINSISDEKLEEAPAGVLANIAKQLSGVVKDMEPEVAPGPTLNQGVQFVVFAPQVVQESKFGVIELTE